MGTDFPLYMNEELRAMMKNQRSFDSAVMRSSLMPSEKYSCSGSPLKLMNGRTAMAGRSGSGRRDETFAGSAKAVPWRRIRLVAFRRV